MPKYTNSIKLPKGANWTAEVVPDEGYNSGTLNKASGMMLSDDTVSASEATLKILNITIIPSEHQEIWVTCNGIKYTESFQIPYGTLYTAITQPDMWYTQGELNIPGEGIFTEDTTITVTDGEIQDEYYIDIIPAWANPDEAPKPAIADQVGASCTYVWGEQASHDNQYGEIIQPYQIIDIVAVYLFYDPVALKTESTTVVCFWGPEAPPLDIEFVEMVEFTYPTNLVLFENVPKSAISSAGDLLSHKYGSFQWDASAYFKSTDTVVKEFLEANIGKKTTLHIKAKINEL